MIFYYLYIAASLLRRCTYLASSIFYN